MNSMKKDMIGLGTIVIFLAIVGLFFAFAKDAEPSFGPEEIESGSIQVEDQYELDQVALHVETSEPGFVTIHESMGEAPGQTIGVSDYLEPGAHDITIPLTVDMTLGLTYITILHVDDGNKIFNLREDMAAMVDDEVIRPSFVARTRE